MLTGLGATMTAPPVDEARDLLLQSVDVPIRQVLASKLQLLATTRSEAADGAANQIRQEHGARGQLNSSATMRKSWEVALAQARETTSATIETCFDVGVSNDEQIAAFAREDFQRFLTSFMMSRFGHIDSTSL